MSDRGRRDGEGRKEESSVSAVHRAHSEIRTIFELEIGLPYRFQLDSYLETLKQGGDSGPLELAAESVEVRWAFAGPSSRSGKRVGAPGSQRRGTWLPEGHAHGVYWPLQ